MGKLKPILIVVAVLLVVAILYLQWPKVSGFLPDNLPVIGRGGEQPSAPVAEFPGLGEPRVQPQAPPAQVAPAVPAVPVEPGQVQVPQVPTIAPPVVVQPPVAQPQLPTGPGVVERSLEGVKPLASQAAQKGGSLWREMTYPFSLPWDQMWLAIKIMPARAILVWLIVLAFGGFSAGTVLVGRFKRSGGKFIGEIVPEGVLRSIRPVRGATINKSLLAYATAAVAIISVVLTMLNKGGDTAANLLRLSSLFVGILGFVATFDAYGEAFINRLTSVIPATVGGSTTIGGLWAILWNIAKTIIGTIPLAIFRFGSLFALFGATASATSQGLDVTSLIRESFPSQPNPFTTLMGMREIKEFLIYLVFFTYRVSLWGLDLVTRFIASLGGDAIALLMIAIGVLIYIVVRHWPAAGGGSSLGRGAGSVSVRSYGDSEEM